MGLENIGNEGQRHLETDGWSQQCSTSVVDVSERAVETGLIR